MKILLLGVGMQGKAVLHDLVRSEQVTAVVAADREFEALQTYVANQRYGDKVRCEPVEAARPESIERLLAAGADVVVDLLPTVFAGHVAAAAVRQGIHLVNTVYARPEVKEWADEARARNITILPEFGMDPGLDLVLLGQAVRSLDRIEEIITYGAGFPEPEAANNPLQYKVTWTFEGVLKSYRRAGRVIRAGQVVEIKANEMFYPENVHQVEIAGLGQLEAYPNGDALKYADLLGLDQSGLRTMGRYVLCWPGHCAFWQKIVDLHLLDDEPVMVNGQAVDRKQFLAAILEPQLQYAAHERDVVVVRIEVKGWQGQARQRVVYQVIDRRDLETGFMAMNRTVGYTASIGAQMIGTGQITQRGLLSPVNDIPYEPFARALSERGIEISSEVTAWA